MEPVKPTLLHITVSGAKHTEKSRICTALAASLHLLDIDTEFEKPPPMSIEDCESVEEFPIEDYKVVIREHTTDVPPIQPNANVPNIYGIDLENVKWLESRDVYDGLYLHEDPDTGIELVIVRVQGFFSDGGCVFEYQRIGKATKFAGSFNHSCTDKFARVSGLILGDTND